MTQINKNVHIKFLSIILFTVLFLLTGNINQAHAALSTYVGTITQPNATTGNQVITGLGFQPKVIIFFSDGLTATGNGATIQNTMGVGISSSSRRAITGYSLDAGSAGYRGESTTSVIRFATNGGTVSEADLVTMDSDGFTINWTTCDATQRIIGFTALGGSDVSNVFLGDAQEKTAPTGNQAYTGVGFQPNTVLIFQNRSSANAPPFSTAGGNGQPVFGFLKSSTERMAVYSQYPAAAGNANKSRQKAVAKGYTSALVEADMVSMDSDGFTLNYTTAANAARYFFYLAIKGPKIGVGTFNQPTSTGNSGVTGVGFTPSSIILASINQTSNTAEQSGGRFSWGSASDTTHRFASWRGSKDAANPTVVKTRLQTNKVITMATEASGGPTVNAEADLTSFDSDGFTLNWSTVDATAREVIYWAFGANSSAPTITTPTQTSITGSGATLGGNVTSDGGATVTGRGVCVGTSSNPSVGGTCFSTSGTTGTFTVSATSLIQGTLYHYRAYATNSVGTSYTSDDTFTTLVLNNYLVTVVSPQTVATCSTDTNSVTARDSTNATITTDASTVNMTSSGTGVTFYTTNGCSSSTTQYTLSSGVANIYYKTNVAQSFTITATKASSTETGTSSSITVNAGSQTRLVITLPGETFIQGTGNAGTVTRQNVGIQFRIPVISATDDYFNVITGYSGSKTLAYSGPSSSGGTPIYTTSVSFTSGQSTTALLTTLKTAETTTITATDGGSYGYASSSLTINTGGINIKSGTQFRGKVKFQP